MWRPEVVGAGLSCWTERVWTLIVISSPPSGIQDEGEQEVGKTGWGSVGMGWADMAWDEAGLATEAAIPLPGPIHQHRTACD